MLVLVWMTRCGDRHSGVDTRATVPGDGGIKMFGY
jgi:hypothetical protein